jgi:hypothetical protein
MPNGLRKQDSPTFCLKETHFIGKDTQSLHLRSMDLTDIYKIFHPTAVECIFSLQPLELSPKC